VRLGAPKGRGGEISKRKKIQNQLYGLEVIKREKFMIIGISERLS